MLCPVQEKKKFLTGTEELKNRPIFKKIQFLRDHRKLVKQFGRFGPFVTENA